jgi:hypothetical protein|nr:MAG TPA: NUMOD4 motif protein [Caudoviricetes sp.]
MWRIIEEFPNYIINEYGTIYKVYGKKNLRIMKPKLDKDGYLYIGLRNDKVDTLEESINWWLKHF